MSALPAAWRPSKPTLHAIDTKRRRMSTPSFAGFVLAFLGLGMGGIVMLSTVVQQQSAELSKLQATEAALSYQEAALSAQAQDLRSSQNLAQRAWDMGMRPNPNPAFIEVPSGNVVGVESPTQGNELPGMTPRNR